MLDKTEIVHNYLRGWFFIDLLATVNWGSLAQSYDPKKTLPTWVKKLAMLKILRLARMGRLLDNLTKNFTIHSGFIEAAKFFVYTAVVCHLLACFFFLIPMLISSDGFMFLGFKTCAKDEAAHAAARQCILNADDCSEDDFPTSGVGWYWHEACMQGSWREDGGNEEICLPGICGATTYDGETEVNLADFDAVQNHKWVWAYDDGPGELGILTTCQEGTAREGQVPLLLDSIELPEGALTTVLLECIDTASNGWRPGDPRFTVCNKCKGRWRLYWDSLYWSLTTMTTIGYGDRGPKTESELVYTIFAEVFGLAFFALLLTQINNVNDLLGVQMKDFKQYKDGVLQFMDARQLDPKLVTETVKFLNFRSTSLSGNSFNDADPRFDHLSKGIRHTIRCAVYLPPLKRIGFFGWDGVAEIEENGVKTFFDKVDTSGDGRLDKEEIRELFQRLEIRLSVEQFEHCFQEIDRNGTGTIDFVEFSWWWFKTKYGVPRNSSGTKAPMEFLNALASSLTPRPFPKNERLVEPGRYGQEFVIVLQGTVRVLRPGLQPGFKGSSPDDPERITKRDRFVMNDDREPMFGFMACLTKLQFDHVRNRTDYWAVDAETYVDTLWCSRKNFYRCFNNHWLKGRADMVEMAYYHYEIGNIVGAKSALDADSDSVVEHAEFVAGSAEIPHGFADHHHLDNKKTSGGALDTERLSSQARSDEKDTELELLEDSEILKVKVQSMSALCATLTKDVRLLTRGLKAVVKHQQIDWTEARPTKETDEPIDTRKSVDINTLDLAGLGKRDMVCLARLLGAKAEEHMKKDKLKVLILQRLKALDERTTGA